MNEETSFTAQFRTEGTPAFPVENTENDNSASSPEGEETNTEQTPSSEGEQTQAQEGESQDGQKADGEKGRGFADDPRWKEREEDWKTRFNEQETRHADELAKVTSSIPELIAKALQEAGASKPEGDSTPTEVPSWFGGDEEQWAEFQKWNSGLLAQAETRGAEKALKGIEEKTEAEQKAIDDATNYMNEEVAKLETDKEINPKGEKIDRNKLLKFVLDNDLVDSQGRWNYKAGYRMMQGLPAKAASESTAERKKIASETTSENRAEVKPQPYVTSQDFSKEGARPW